MKHLPLVLVAVLTVAMLAATGCSKKESEQAVPLPPPSTTTINKTEPPPLPRPITSAPATNVQPAQPSPAASTTPPGAEEETPAQLAAQVKQLENDYKNTSDLQKRVTIIYDLSSNESPDTIDAIGRLFLNEKDQELKIELIDSLTDIDGQNDKKLAILSSALRADQPKDVRSDAIDGIGDLEDKRGIQVLQVYANDPDEDIRDSIKDTIQQLQDLVTPPQSPLP
jgi:type IV secretory pathway VirB10-like protein